MVFQWKLKRPLTNCKTDSDLITINNFFGHLVKEISVTKYGSDKELISIISPYEIYQYSDTMLKHLAKDSLKRIEKTMLHSKEPVYLNKASLDRTVHDDSQAGTTGTTAQIAARKANDAKFHWSLTKATNTPQFMIATMLSWLQSILNY